MRAAAWASACSTTSPSRRATRRSKHSVERVLIVDWDVHHGNGTQDIFYRDASVFFFSSHQWPLYPGTGRADETGEGPGEGSTMNFPFPAGVGPPRDPGRRRKSPASRRRALPARPGADLGGLRFPRGRPAGKLHPHRRGFCRPHPRRDGHQQWPRGLGARRRIQPAKAWPPRRQRTSPRYSMGETTASSAPWCKRTWMRESGGAAAASVTIPASFETMA